MAQDLVTRLTANNTDLKKKLQESKIKVQELEASVKRLNATQKTNQQTITKLGQAYNKVHKENKLLKQFESLNIMLPNMGNGFGSLSTMIGKITPQTAAATAAFAMLSKGVSDNTRFNKELAVSLSALKAITGDSTEAMNTYREAAIQMGRTTPQTASQVAEAFKTIAQMKPELTKNKQGLIDVTEASLALANAQGTDVATAADIVTRALNVYGQSARYANQYVNVLAAGCRNGSGDIEWLGNAFGKAGATVKAVGMSYEDTITTLELLSRRIKDSTSAGAQLRNVLIYLEKTNDDELRPSVVGISQALKNLADREYDLNTITNIFKKQNIEAATTLIEYAGEFDNLREKVTGTNTAFEMAQTRQDNLTGAINRLDSAWQSFMLSLGNSDGVLAAITDGLANMINAWAGVSDVYNNAFSKSKDKTDKILFDLAVEFAEKGNDKEEIKKQLQQKIAERKKYLEGQIARAEKDRKHAVLAVAAGRNDSPRMYANQIEEYTAQLDALSTKASQIDLIVSDAFQDIESKKQNATLAIAQQFDLEEASITELKQHLKELKKQRDNTNDTAQLIKYNSLISECQARIDTLTGKATKQNKEAKSYAEGTVGWFTQQIQLLNEQINESGDKSIISQLQTKIEEYKKIIDDLQGKTVEIKPEIPAGSLKDLQEKLSKAIEQIKLATDDETIKVLKETIEVLQKQIAELEAKLGLSHTSGSGTVLSDVEQMNQALSSTGEIISNVGNAFSMLGEDAGNAMSAICNSIQTVMQAIIQYQSVADAASKAQVANKTAEASANASAAIAGGTASAASLPFPYNIAAIAVVIGAIITALSNMSKFATGGIVGGNSLSGDNNIVRVNSGEMILNKHQQANLFRMINSGVSGNSGNVTFKISGKDLVGTLNNYNSRTGKIL